MAPAKNALHLVRWLVLLIGLGAASIPTGVSARPDEGENRLPGLQAFAASVADGNPRLLRGVYAEGLFALAVVQQRYAAEVSRLPNTATQFAMAAEFGVTGLMAHNYLSGQEFFQLRDGQRINLIYGDGSIRTYWVTGEYRYRATEPLSTTSNFVDLTTGEALSAESLFRNVFMGKGRVTFETCIARDGNLSWGRLFVIAEPTPLPSSDALRPGVLSALPPWRTRLALPF